MADRSERLTHPSSIADRKFPPRTPRLFHGWIVVGGVFLVSMIGFGTAYSFTAFFAPLQHEFSASRRQVSLVFGVAGFIYFSLGALSGNLADRFGPRRVIIWGVLAMGLGLVLASYARTLFEICTAYGLGVGLGVGLSYVPGLSTVQRWFERRRGLASGLAVAGNGVGTLVIPPLAAWLIQTADWRVAYRVLALVVVSVGIGAAMLIEPSPQARGLLPDGDIPEAAGAPLRAAYHSRGMTPRQAVNSGTFWLLYAASLMNSLGLFIPLVHMVPYVRDRGLGEAVGVLTLGLIGIGSTAGRFIVGATADRLGRRPSMMAMFAGMAVMLLWWSVAARVWSLAVFAILFGLCFGGYVALLPALTTDYFGVRSAGGVIGILYTSNALGALLGPTLAGAAYDFLRSYTLPIVGGALLNLAAAGCVAAIAPHAYREPA
jgi:MFS transporter, OFA family, oxalate/formate antiporter